MSDEGGNVVFAGATNVKDVGREGELGSPVVAIFVVVAGAISVGSVVDAVGHAPLDTFGEELWA